MKNKIEKAIRETLVVENKQSIDRCVEKIYKICNHNSEYIHVPDIRNKLTPLLNLITMIESGVELKWINRCLDDCKKSIKYLSRK